MSETIRTIPCPGKALVRNFIDPASIPSAPCASIEVKPGWRRGRHVGPGVAPAIQWDYDTQQYPNPQLSKFTGLVISTASRCWPLNLFLTEGDTHEKHQTMATAVQTI